MYAIGLIFFCLAVSRKLILKVYFRTLSQKMKANVYDKVQAPDVAQLNELGKLTQQKTKAPATSGMKLSTADGRGLGDQPCWSASGRSFALQWTVRRPACWHCIQARFSSLRRR
jgi:hypothetical protein